jgi:predicted amidophosphoribosyltransferase
LRKVKELPQIKNLKDYESRKETLKDAYEIVANYDFSGVEGFLIIDDVYESGSTLREICRTLNREVPEIPRYVLTLTHLKSVWSESR